MSTSTIKGFVIIMAVAAAFSAYYACKFLFRISPLDAFLMFIKILFGNASEAVTKANESMRSRTLRMSKEDRKKSLRYKYQVLINDILLDLGWRQIGVTINGITMISLVAAMLLSVLGYVAMRSLFMTLILFIGIYIVIITALFSISRERHRNRKALIIQAEDALCASMNNGLTEAIRMNISNFDPEIRDDFQAYLNDIDCNMPIVEAIDRLNDRVGSKLDNFCEKAKDFSENYQPGSEDNFMFNISSNAIETELDNEIYEYSFNANMDYFATLMLLVIFFFVTNSMYSSMTEFYYHGPGKFLIIFYISIAIAVYIYTQWQTSRRT